MFEGGGLHISVYPTGGTCIVHAYLRQQVKDLFTVVWCKQCVSVRGRFDQIGEQHAVRNV